MDLVKIYDNNKNKRDNNRNNEIRYTLMHF